MKFTVEREHLLKPLQQVSGPLGGRPTLPILGNLLLQVADGALSLTVPSVEAMLASMQDTQPFKVVSRGRTLIDLQWHHGREAREALSQCLRGR